MCIRECVCVCARAHACYIAVFKLVSLRQGLTLWLKWLLNLECLALASQLLRVQVLHHYTWINFFFLKKKRILIYKFE